MLLSCISTLSTGTHLKPEPAPAILASFPLCARALLVSPAKLGKNVCWGVVFLEKEWYQFLCARVRARTQTHTHTAARKNSPANVYYVCFSPGDSDCARLLAGLTEMRGSQSEGGAAGVALAGRRLAITQPEARCLDSLPLHKPGVRNSEPATAGLPTTTSTRTGRDSSGQDPFQADTSNWVLKFRRILTSLRPAAAIPSPCTQLVLHQLQFSPTQAGTPLA